jgi:hypothetical protein
MLKIIKERLKISDEETVEQIQENHYLQYFLGYASCCDKRPFDLSMMVHFRKRLGAEVIKELNDLIVARERSKGDSVKSCEYSAADREWEDKKRGTA